MDKFGCFFTTRICNKAITLMCIYKDSKMFSLFNHRAQGKSVVIIWRKKTVCKSMSERMHQSIEFCYCGTESYNNITSKRRSNGDNKKIINKTRDFRKRVLVPSPCHAMPNAEDRNPNSTQFVDVSNGFCCCR